MDHDVDEDEGGGGKGKKRSATVNEPSPSRKARAVVKAIPLYPWVMLSGEVNLRMLMRIRKAAINRVHDRPGSSAAAVRDAVFRFMTPGEVLLVMEDLARRGVFTKMTVPSDLESATLGGGWGVARPRGTGAWVKAERVTGNPASTSVFIMANGWVHRMAQMEGLVDDNHGNSDNDGNNG
ncbi:unnamed protein product [Discosporangium mesarthrocarpum]